jgi:hypothetical protein
LPETPCQGNPIADNNRLKDGISYHSQKGTSMLALTLTTLSLLTAQGDGATVELFAKEGWYKEQKGEVKEFVGVLRKTERDKNIIGFGRTNPFRLEMDGNKVREVYVGSQGKLLDPYVGKKIKLTGKAVDMEVEGRRHLEIWAASLVVLQGDKKGADRVEPKEGGKSVELKIHGKTPMRVGQGATVIKSAEQLGKLMNMDADKASASLAKAMKVDSIDWTKQMVVTISGGTQRTGGYSVEAKSVEVKDGKFVVNWKLNTPAPGSIVTQALTNPSLTILVDRHEGDVQFNPASPPAGGKKLGIELPPRN